MDEVDPKDTTHTACTHNTVALKTFYGRRVRYISEGLCGDGNHKDAGGFETDCFEFFFHSSSGMGIGPAHFVCDMISTIVGEGLS